MKFAVTYKKPMLYGRGHHAVVYHSHYVYVLGGLTKRREIGKVCERYLRAEDRWEALPEMPSACQLVSAVVLAGSLFLIGGKCNPWDNLNLIQRLNLDTLTWQIMQLNLPVSGLFIPCFKVCDTQVFLVMDKSLYSFTPFEIKRLRSVNMDEDISSFGSCYYSKGTLYCSSDQGAATRIEIGSI
jgi:hypothetical protein